MSESAGWKTSIGKKRQLSFAIIDHTMPITRIPIPTFPKKYRGRCF